MSKLIFAILLAVLLPFAASAQTKEWRGQGYVFVAPTNSTAVGFGVHVGVGGEGLVYKGLGLGGEAGYFGDGAGILSTNVSYHFTKASKSGKFAPFVTSGYSLVFPSDAVHAFNVGGGMNWWFKDRIGLRLEFRDHIPIQSGSSHLYGVRIGLAFR